MIEAARERDPLESRFVRSASGLLRAFNEAGVIDAADVHVARRLGVLAGEADEAVLLGIALAVRAPRLGHVHVDLGQIRDTAAVDAEEPVDISGLDWPQESDWVTRVRRSPLVTDGEPDGDAAVAMVAAATSLRPLRLSGSRLYLDRYWSEEVQVAGALRAMAADEAPGVDGRLLADGVARLFGGDAAGEQALAAATAVKRRLAVVAGGPGTGKTTTVARIVALICEQAAAAGTAAPLIALAAPTGKAAARLEEAVHAEAERLDIAPAVREQLRALPASTLHRLLGWRPGSTSRFRHDHHQRLPHDVVIVDETSMVSLSLMARLIEALRTGARLILVGDPGQLASIEAGAVLGDIVGPPGDRPLPGIVVLDRVHRFGGGIARLATAIRAGDAEAAISLLRDPPADVSWLAEDVAETDAPAAVREPALRVARATVQAARAGAAGAALRSLNEFRLLCAHRRGPYGVSTWTARMESWLSAELPGFDPDERWYAGRPLLVNENDYELRLNNGDTGVIVHTAEDRVLAAFPRGGEAALYPPSRLGAIETVYAMTIHKSQGSQFETAAVLLPEPGSRILTRELLYTAATRAQRHLIIVGTEEAVRAAIARPVARASGLGARLRARP
ncbi:MAG TPA: exodeoxyribonuclease V subunit alpha [Solirubrobacteraceae bacterium]|nr:exodeoxyribonuclease V subunit alpha [Solirubrobacteraceae bacterium]